MFDLGLAEIAIIGVLGWLAFRHVIARLYPGIYRALHIVLLTVVGLLLLFGLLARLHG